MEFPRACKTIADLTVGDRFELKYRVSDNDVQLFGQISGDFNPVHFDDEYASASMFGRRIAHGMISLSKFSGIFGMDFPGLGTLWLSQAVQFLKPVFIDVEYTAIAEVTALDRRRATISTRVEDGSGEDVLRGEAVIIPISDLARNKLEQKA